jgi:dTMP kinase
VVSGFFLTFEGIEKSGKTTQADLLVDRLRAEGRDVVFTLEPGGTRLGEGARRLLLDPNLGMEVSQRAEVFLFAADRAQHIEEVIRPALDAGKLVISDRFVDSTIAYQGHGRGVDLAELNTIQEFATGGLRPDLTVLVDVDVDTSRARMEAADRLESEDDGFFERVREGYLSLWRAEPERILRVDGRMPLRMLSEAIYAEVDRQIGGDGERTASGGV